MHPYTVQSARWKVIGVIMLVSVGVSPLIQRILAYFQSLPPNIVFGLILPSGLPTFLLFTALYILFKKSAWRWPIIRWFVSQPDLNGTWTGSLESSYQNGSAEGMETDGGKKQFPRIEIDQDWSHIEIVLETEHSISHSTSATFRTNKTFPELVLTYVNNPKREPTTELDMHEGTNILRVTRGTDNQMILEGEYYTDEKRNNHGTMRFTRLKD